MTTLTLPYPSLVEGRSVSVPFYTDEKLFNATGVRVAFTTRHGGVSAAPFDTLNVGIHVSDEASAVQENRHRILQELKGSTSQLIVPKQVHGDTLVSLDHLDDLDVRVREAEQGADGVIVEAEGVAALLAFADCVPVIIVDPNASFAVVHAGWRGVDNRIAVKALRMLAGRAALRSDCSLEEYYAQTNIYIGPYIHAECFEVSAELAAHFADEFGLSCLLDERHVDLGAALRGQLMQIGVDPARVADLDCCTVCNHDLFYSYRANGGQTGRHAAVALRLPS